MANRDDDCANPLLLGWCREWLDRAREQNSKSFRTYKTAYDSLRACPLAFDHPAELQQLRGFGPTLCDRLTEKLRRHCEQTGEPMPPHPAAAKKRKNPDPAGPSGDGDGPDGGGEGNAPRPKKKARAAKAYAPAFRSGAYALVLALATLDESSSVGLTKPELIVLAQPFCDASFTAPSDPTKFYTAWNSMKTLVSKELVFERRNPVMRYALTDEGWVVARNIQRATAKMEGSGQDGGAAAEETTERPPPPLDAGVRSVPIAIDDSDAEAPEHDPGGGPDDGVVSVGAAVSGTSDLPTFKPIILKPGTFDVHLVIDNREVRAKNDRDYLQNGLTAAGAPPLTRALDVGDMTWVAKVRDASLLARHGAEGDEVVLDWIVERKRLDDLVASIRDGRYHEQKWRLARSGVRNVVYVVEHIAMDPTQYARAEQSVNSAVYGMQVVSGYRVRQTAKVDDTIRYLASMTRLLKEKYEGSELRVIPTRVLTARNYLPLVKHLREAEPEARYYVSYMAFAGVASKSELLTLRDVFLRMLMCIRGVTGERALMIQKVWKTPWYLIEAYKALGGGEVGKRRKLELMWKKFGKEESSTRKIGKKLSENIAAVWADLSA